MFDITGELRALVSALEKQEIDYALCGGMAIAVHGRLRATIGIDLLIPAVSQDDVLAIAKSFGYNVRGKNLSFANGAIEIRRVSKIDPERWRITLVRFADCYAGHNRDVEIAH